MGSRGRTSSRDRTACRSRGAVLLGLAAGAALAAPRARAFPLSDVTSPSVVAPASAAPSDASDAAALAHQAQLLNGYRNNVSTGFNYSFSASWQEIFNDNVFQTSTDRRWDLITDLTPGLAVYNDSPNAQIRLNYQPSLLYYTENTSLNQVTQSLNGTGDFVLWQDHLFLDTRALAGVGATNGNAPGLGFGNSGGSAGLQSSTANLTKQNSTQYTSLEVSPYFLQRFGDYGTLKVGYTFARSSSSNAASLSPVQFSSTGVATTELTNEELVQFTTGPISERITDTVLFDAQQMTSSSAGSTSTALGEPQTGHNTRISDQVNYIMNREVMLFGSIGYETIDYGGSSTQPIHGPTWQVGTTLTPNPRSSMTVSYGHQDGADSWTVNGFYALTARTSISVSYDTTLGTQLQQLQNQLAASSVSNNGTLVNSQNGSPVYPGNNLVGSQNGVYRIRTATIGSTTSFDRDTVSVTLQSSDYTSTGTGLQSNTSGVTGTANWYHQIREDLTLSASASYGLRWGGGIGGSSAYTAFTSSLAYALSATLNASLNYSFYDVTTKGANQSMYQDLILASLTKQF